MTPEDPCAGLDAPPPCRLPCDPALAFAAAAARLKGLWAVTVLHERWGLTAALAPEGKLTLTPGPVPREALDFAREHREVIRRRLQRRTGR